MAETTRNAEDTASAHCIQLNVSTGGKIAKYVAMCMDALKNNKSVSIVGTDKAMNKSISVAEITKAQLLTEQIGTRQTNKLEFHEFNTQRSAEKVNDKLKRGAFRVPQLTMELHRVN